MIEKGIIEIAPLAFMRGRTLNDAFIILDEAQNTTVEQMKMYLTRLGFNSKTVVVYFSGRDVVRHRLVRKILKAYDSYEKRKKEDHS
jgi:phosphate starvation-inducible PhoH-like protein